MLATGSICSRLEADVRGHEDIISSQKGLQDAKQRDFMSVSRQADLHRINPTLHEHKSIADAPLRMLPVSE